MALIELTANITWISALLFVVGIGLLTLEMFDPGFWIAGILGLLSLVACIIVTTDTLIQGVMLTVFFAILILIMFGVFVILVSKGKLPGRPLLHEMEAEEEHEATSDLLGFIGKTGIVMSVCRPVGNADFDGAKLEVVSREASINKGVVVEAVEVEGNLVVVKSIGHP